MAITSVGYDGTVTETQFSRLMRYVGEVAYKHGVPTGLTASAAAGTRQVSITAGTAVLPGLLVDSSATVTTTHAANTGTTNRADLVVLRADWTANTTSLAVVQGSSSTPPALTQIEGSLWEMPLALVTVRPSVSTLLSSDVAVCKPLPRVARTATGSLSSVTRAYNSTFFTVGTITMTDPGWPYRVQVLASGRFGGGQGSGYALLGTTVNGTSLGDEQSTRLDIAGTHSVRLSRISATQTGPTTVLAQISPLLMSSGSSLILQATDSFAVSQIPA